MSQAQLTAVLTNVGMALLPLVGLLITALVGRLLNTLNANVKDQRVHATILRFCQAAAQIIPDTTHGRYDLVETWVSQTFPQIPHALVDAYIEAGVAALKMSLGEFTNSPTGPTARQALALAPGQPPTPETQTPAR